MLFLPSKKILTFCSLSQFSIDRHMSHAPSRPPTMRRVASGDKLATSAAPRPAAHAGIALRARFRQHGLLSFGLPSEMWGAASVALQLSKGSAAPALTRAASAAWKPLSTATTAPEPSGEHPKSIAEALEYKPSLSLLEDALCLLGAAGLCAALYCCTAPAGLQLHYAASMALLYAVLLAAGRAWLLERKYQALQRSERELAALDSKFLNVGGIEVHYKCRSPRLPPNRTAARPPVPPPAATNGAGQAQSTPPSALSPTPAPAPSAGSTAGAAAGAGQAQQAQQGAARAVHCLHGFGASAYSWSFVQDDLARELGAVVTAHDMPGFGLTQRPAERSFYTLGFNGAAARAVMDAELASLAPRRQGSAAAPAAGGADGEAQAPLSRQAQRVLVGHSMGGAAVAEGVINDPEGISAIVLVAPAIVALWPGPPQQAQRDGVATGLAVVEEVVSAQDPPDELELESQGESQGDFNKESYASGSAGQAAGTAGAATAGTAAAAGSRGAAPRFRHRVARWRPARVAVALAQAAALFLVQAVLRLATPLLVLLLRSLVRSRRFWERGLASAWVDKSRVDREYVDSYRSGQLVRGWEAGLLNFLAGRFAEKLSFWDTLHHVLKGDGHLSQAERLAQVVQRHGIRVLIVHGADDLLVPAANSRRLARLLPGARLEEFVACGHMPQEEMPERFVRVVAEFLAEGGDWAGGHDGRENGGGFAGEGGGRAGGE